MQNKRTLFGINLGVLLIAGGAASLAQAHVKLQEDRPGQLAQATFPAAKALRRVQSILPKGKIVEAGIEEEKGRLIYSFDVKVPGKSGIDEVNLSAKDGSLVAHTHEGPKAERQEARSEAKNDRSVSAR